MLTTLLKTAAIWFHMMATIVLVGHYLLTVLDTLPVLKKSLKAQDLFRMLSDLSSQVQPRIFASLGVFILSGIYLMLINPSYLGIGNFGNLWSALMLVKHLIVVGMIILAIQLNKTLKARLSDPNQAGAALKRAERLIFALSAGGILVILFTAIVQAQ
jgi:uncharacterized membrane protein